MSSPGRFPARDFLLAFFLAVAVFFLPVKDGSGAFGSLAIVFVSIVFEAIPFMFVGALIGGLLEEFVSRERLTALLPRRGWLTVCVAQMAFMLTGPMFDLKLLLMYRSVFRNRAIVVLASLVLVAVLAVSSAFVFMDGLGP